MTRRDALIIADTCAIIVLIAAAGLTGSLLCAVLVFLGAVAGAIYAWA